jgi:dTDP-4-amino-4,6-dideoxygalactose transaminase
LILPAQKAFSYLDSFGESFQVSELLAGTVLSLPMHGLIEEQEVRLVAETLIKIINDQS